MKNLWSRIIQHRFGLIALTTLNLIVIATVTRIVLLFYSFNEIPHQGWPILEMFFIGLFFDLVAGSYYSIPLVLLLLLVPNRWINFRAVRWAIGTIIFLNMSLLVIDSIGEFLFWNEFNTRYNFIAVDYLVYTNEVVGNITQSYSVEWISVLALLATLICFALLFKSIKIISSKPLAFKARLAWALSLFTLPVLSFTLVSNQLHHFSTNAYLNELAGDGIYELFAAYRNNELSYDQFYKKIDIDQAFKIVRNQLEPDESKYISAGRSITRKIAAKGPEKRMNVVLISVESFSASFMAAFGNKDNITPHLDSLAKKGILFRNLYATGTRTVRGLEALSLCIPPTPGQAIVRRPDNGQLYTMGSVFRSKGYDSKFIYGGYGYFDNMQIFFEGNNYEVDDRTKIPDDSIDYENIWGVADENLFELAISEIDKSYRDEKLVFAHIMTTSNHRPFTYPDGRIDIPSHTSRNGAVKYTDYAINQFLKTASKKSWYNNTLFVVVADHCASSAGKTDLPIDRYLIPMIIFSPGFVEPGSIDYMMSQIDVGPTILGLLNISYTSRFMGTDVFHTPEENRHAFISTYQLLGFLKEKSLVVLEPKKKSRYLVIDEAGNPSEVPPIKTTEHEAIAWYQVASYLFTNHLLNASLER